MSRAIAETHPFWPGAVLPAWTFRTEQHNARRAEGGQKPCGDEGARSVSSSRFALCTVPGYREDGTGAIYLMPSRSARAADLTAVNLRGLAIAGSQVVLTTLGLVVAWGWLSRFGVDSHAYWDAWRHGQLYRLGPGQVDAYLYSPAFAQILRPLTWLPWPVFAAMWSTMCAGIFWWLLQPVRLEWRIPLLALCLPEIVIGNVYALFALVLLFGFRRPALWAFPLLTKIAPGVGCVWFAARREWRSLAIVVGATSAIVIASVAFAPSLWVQWLRFLQDNRTYASEGSHLLGVVRIPLAMAVAFIAARTNRTWLLAVALVLSLPVLASYTPLTALTAIPRLQQRERRLRVASPASRCSM